MDYPYGISIICVLFISLSLLSAVNGWASDSFGPIAGVLIPSLFLLYAKSRVTIIDGVNKELKLIEKGVLGKSSQVVNDFKRSSVSICYGRGKYLHAGFVILRSGEINIKLTEPDIFYGDLNKIKSQIEKEWGVTMHA